MKTTHVFNVFFFRYILLLYLFILFYNYQLKDSNFFIKKPKKLSNLYFCFCLFLREEEKFFQLTEKVSFPMQN
jgi:hypothetical protein